MSSLSRSFSNIGIKSLHSSPSFSKNPHPESKPRHNSITQLSNLRRSTLIHSIPQNPRKTILATKLAPIKVKKVLILDQPPDKQRKPRKHITAIPTSNPLFLQPVNKSKVLKDLNEKFEIFYTTRPGTENLKVKDVNQDRVLVIPSLNPQVSIVAVFDGHGFEGHMVSDFISSTFSLIMSKEFGGSEDLTAGQIESILSNCIKELVFSIKSTPLNLRFSGCTLLCLLFYKTLCFSVNIGDSKAYMYSYNRIWKVQQLNSAHKPSENAEKSRVLKCGGQIGQAINQIGIPYGPLRVLCDSVDHPGITLTRAIGDKAFRDFGVIDVPEIFKFQVKSNDFVFVLATDGLWDFVSESFVADVVKRNWNNGSCEKVVEELLAGVDEAGVKENLDDLSVVVLFKN